MDEEKICKQIQALRKQNYGWRRIAKELNIHHTTARRIMRQAGLYTPARQMPPRPEKPISNAPNRPTAHPLSPGHPLTWLLISKEPFPG